MQLGDIFISPVLIAIYLFLFVPTIVMIVDLVKRKRGPLGGIISNFTKIFWLILLVLFSPVASLVYYFVIKRGMFTGTSLRSFFKNKEILSKIFTTLFIVLIYRGLSSIPLPGVNMEVYQNTFGQSTASEASYIFTIFTGGRLDTPSIVGLGLAAYINASIIMQLLPYALPRLKELQKQGERGRQVINQITRFLALPLSLFYSVAYLLLISQRDFNSTDGVTASANPAYLIDHAVGSSSPTTTKIIFMALILTAGTLFLMWLSELITEKGLGNGSSIIITIGIIATLPTYLAKDFERINFGETIRSFLEGNLGALNNSFLLSVIAVIVGLIILVVGIIFINESTRNIDVQYARRVRGTEIGQGSSLPIKFTMTGVLPVIFTYALLSVPQLLAPLLNNFASSDSPITKFVASLQTSFFAAPTDGIVDSKDGVYAVVYFVLVMVFGIFYAFIVMNPQETSENLQKSGAFIPGIRPGKSTEKFIAGVLSRISFLGSVMLAFIALTPILASDIIQISTGTNLAILSGIGGTSILITVGVILDTMRQYKSLVATRSYEKYV